MKPATSIEKVCRVLGLFRKRPSMRLTDVAEEVQLLPSGTHRILASLRTYGYVEQDINKKYRLGLELLKLGHCVYANLDVREVAKPLMRSLSENAVATANLVILDPHEVDLIFVEHVDSPSEYQPILRVGSPVEPHATAAGKLLTAYQKPSMAQRILQKYGMPKATRHTITDMDQLLSEFEKIRTLGYATDHEEALEGACCISAPIRDHTGDVVAALSISMTAAKVGPSQEGSLIQLVRSTASRISAELGYEAIHHSSKDGGESSGVRNGVRSSSSRTRIRPPLEDRRGKLGNPT